MSLGTWTVPSENLSRLRTIVYAYLLSRMLFLIYLKEKYVELTPTHFLIHQRFNALAIRDCCISLFELSYGELVKIHRQFIDFQCLFCIDEANLLVSHLGTSIISTMEGNHTQNDRVNEALKRVTLSVLLYGMIDGLFAKKILFAGTSGKLRNIDNFGTHETKAVTPIVLNEFTAWYPQMAVNYVSSLVDIPQSILGNVLTDHY